MHNTQKFDFLGTNKNARNLQNTIVLGFLRLSDKRQFEDKETLSIKNDIKKFRDERKYGQSFSQGWAKLC